MNAESETSETGRNRRIMLVLMIGVFLSPLNITFTSIALPTIRTVLNLSIEQATWVATAYFIPSVALMPLQSYLGARWGVRRLYAGGLAVLSAGGVLSAMAPSFRWLIASRILQGAGWSALYPLALILIRRHFPAGRQGEMMGLWESAVGLGTIVAPLLGGFLISLFGWEAVYLVLALVAAVGALLTPLAIPAGNPTPPTDNRLTDWPGALQFTIFAVVLLLGLTRGLLWLLTAAALGLWWWAWRARRHPAPFVAPRLFTNRRFMAASLAATLRMLVLVAALTALPLFFEDVQGLTPDRVGTLMVIYSLFLFLSSWPGGRWADRAGARVPGAVGFGAMAAGLLLLLTLDAKLSVPLVSLALIVRGIGAGLAQAPYAKAATDAAPPALARMASGLYGTLRYGGLALGTALVGAFLQTRLAFHGAQSGAAALPAFRELWLLLGGLAVVGLGLTWLMVGHRPVPSTEGS